MSAASPPSPPMHESQVAGLARLHQGKVRDIYAIDERHMLIVTTDRLSAFDVVLPDPIPGKGRVLTQISNYWFARTRSHRPEPPVGLSARRARCPTPAARALLADRSMIVRRLNALPVEAVVRGYLIGSRLEGLPAHRRGVRHRAARGAQAGRPAARADLHAVDQGRARPARRERGLRARRGADRRRARRAGARHRDRAVPVRRRARAGARHHHRGYEVRVRHRRGRAR